ncbi:RNA polymerase recycling motor HelD [Virgibacillus sp. DJP39]|uniref:RNA polymerase recycling motor HelD n=1 Tax=Virgibacillus sp. DJP39 TaxID=3409790 RepID=UPI003BB4FF64
MRSNGNEVDSMNQEAKERATEQSRLDYILHLIKVKERIVSQKAQDVKNSVINLRKNFWEDVTVNVDEPDDIIETQASIRQQAELLSQKERGHGKFSEQLKTFKRLTNSPYFGRINFIEEKENIEEPIYIGIASLMDKNGEDFLVYDWRAPISSMYYDFSPGKATYETVVGTITGEITLKRQFIIKNGCLNGMFDTGVTIGDELLQQALGNNASTTMKSIVATIQKEQNKIIRNETSKYLIVQGVAGSGKTSAALQRIAYLMYRNRETLSGDNMVLFSPNPLFSSYVANVLPELGEENMKQKTFQEYLESKVNSHITIESPFKQIEYTLTGESDPHYHVKMKGIHFKSSIGFKEIIDHFITHLGTQELLFKNINFRKRILISKEEISSYFYSLDHAISIPNRMELLSQWLQRELSILQRAEEEKDWVLDEIELLDKEDYLVAHQYVQADDDEEEESFIKEEIFLKKQVVKKRFSSVKKQVKQLKFVNILATYRELFNGWETENTPLEWDEISRQTFADLSRKYLSWEDATPFVYFQGKLIGDTTDRSIRHLIIDEAQDYSAFQYAYIQGVFPYTKMTLLGDLNQGIYEQATQEYTFLPMVSEGGYESIGLTKSYRSTKQIVEFTRSFAAGGELIQPFNREGSIPSVIKASTIANRNKKLILAVKKLAEDGHETIAIICKTVKECNDVFHMIGGELDITKIDEDTHSFKKGIVILPVYWAKGIEFDAVIIPDASEQQYEKESERNLFYTACTRAMHDLTMLTVDEPSRFIKESSATKYKTVPK